MLVRPPKQIITTKPFTSRIGYEVCKDYLFFVPELDKREEDADIYDSLRRPLLGEDLPFDGSTDSKFFKSRVCVDDNFEDTGLKVTSGEANTLSVSAGSMFTYTGGYLSFDAFELDTTPLSSDYWDYVLPSGDITGYTEIATKADLDDIRNDLDGTYVLTGDITFEAADFEVAGDYYNGGEGWIPIGTDSAPFTGTLIGNNHTISGIVIDRSSGYYQGLFGYCDGATFETISLDDFDIDCLGYVGALSGYFVNGTIDRCIATNIVLDWDRYYCGGLLGYVDASEIINSSTTTVSITSSTGTAGFNIYAGGFCGILQESCSVRTSFASGITIDIDGAADGSFYIGGFISIIFSDITIENSYSTSVSISGEVLVQGGFLSYSNVSIYQNIITSCYSSCTLQTDVNTSSTYCGGFIGRAYGYHAITNCYAVGSSTMQSYGFNGGFIGRAFTTTECTNCYAAVDLTGGGTGYIGGLIGFHSGKISSCFWDMEVSGVSVSAGGVGKNTTQMQGEQFIYADWDTDVWVFVDDSYPELIFQNNLAYFVIVFNSDSLDVDKITTPDVDEYGETEGYYCGLLDQTTYELLISYGFPKEALMILSVVYLDDIGQITNIEEQYANIYNRVDSLFPANLYTLNGGVLRNSGWYETW